MLVIQIGYDQLSTDDILKISTHMKIAHGLRPYVISA
jgi:hypothetical protein